jgi:hypothetical protein
MTEKRQSAAPQQGPGTEKMAIGEFDGAATLTGETGPLFVSPIYWLYEMSLAALNPSRAFADATRLLFKNPANPLAHTTYGKTVAAAAELFERSTRRYHRPEWNIHHTTVGGERVPACAAAAAAETADRRADVGPLPDAAARHGGDVSVQSRRLSHRMD